MYAVLVANEQNDETKNTKIKNTLLETIEKIVNKNKIQDFQNEDLQSALLHLVEKYKIKIIDNNSEKLEKIISENGCKIKFKNY